MWTRESFTVSSATRPFLEEPFVGLHLELGLREVGLHGRRRGLLVESLPLDPDARVDEIGLAGFELLLGILRVALELGVGHLEEDRARFDLRARLPDDRLDPAVGPGRDLAGALGNDDERARSAHLPQHRAALDRVGIERALVDSRCGGLEARKSQGDEQDDRRRRRDEEYPLALPLLREVFPNDIHECLQGEVHARGHSPQVIENKEVRPA